MTNNTNSTSQFELFPGSSKKTPETQKRQFSFKSITLSLDNIIIMSIVFILAGVLFYSYGVESGRKVAKIAPNLSAEKKAVQNQKNGVLLHSADSDITITTNNVERNRKRGSSTLRANEEIIEIPIPLERKIVVAEGFTIQVASFKLEKNAKKEAGKIQVQGFESFVVPKGNYSIVCVGRFIERGQAKAYSSRLKRKYNDCLVRRL